MGEGSAWRSWAAVLGIALALLGLDQLCRRPPPPRGAAERGFSEERARALISELVDGVGRRMAGTEPCARAAQLLAERLRQIPGVEVEIQEAAGVHPWGGGALAYRAQNVLARLRGRRPDAILLSAHYDSPLESVGAQDDARGVAVAVEVLSELAREGGLENSVVLNLNGAEEAGLGGANGFLPHPWMADVRAFINLEGAGTAGKTLLFRSSADSGWMVSRYAAAVSGGFATSVGDDLMATGLVPSETDFLVYTERAHLPGLDLATIEDGYAHHTALDTMARLGKGSVQHMGDTALSLTRDLASRPLPARGEAAGQERAVYYDVLGRFVVAHGRGAARAMALTALAGALIAAALAIRRAGARAFLAALGVAGGGLVLAIVTPAAFSALPAMALGRPHGFFATPAPALVGFAALSLAGGTALPWLWARRSRLAPELRAHAAWVATLVSWAVVLGAGALADVASSFVPLWWVAGGLVGLAAARAAPRYGAALRLAAVAPAALLTLQTGATLVAFLLPTMGRVDFGLPGDLVVAAAVGLIAAPLVGFAGAGLHDVGGHGRVAAISALAGVACAVVWSALSPYSPERPKRVWIEHYADGSISELRFAGWDYPALRDAVGTLPGIKPAERRAASPAPGSWATPASPFDGKSAAVQVLSEESLPGGRRRVSLRLENRDNPSTVVFVPRDALVGWSLSDPVPTPWWGMKSVLASFVGPPGSTWDFTLELSGEGKVPVPFKSIHPTESADLTQARSQLPPWTTVTTYVAQVQTLSL